MTAAEPSGALTSARRASERGVHATWLYTLASIIVFVLIVDAIILLRGLVAVTASGSLVDVLIVAFTLVSMLVQIRYCWFLRVGLGGGLPRSSWTIALIGAAAPAWVLGLFSPLLWHVSAVPLWVSAVLIACGLPRRRRWWTLTAGFALVLASYGLARMTLGGEIGFSGGPDIGLLLIYAAFFPAAVLFSLWWWNIVVELDQHRRSAAELAIAKERLRFAADLHDIQGHHLQVIALKAELAERMLERDPVAAREQLRETREVAAQALQETRSLVAGYRDATLDEELENAREVLSATGAACDLSIGAMPSNPGGRRALAFVVREATTNIIRHSSAGSVRIALTTENGCCVLTVSNDGVSATPSADGSGLAGLRARVAEHGGTLTTQLDAGRFELIVTIPDRGARTSQSAEVSESA
ncbi:sensor histidine kinase [Paramicrobacterium agarici]|uniref:Two-component system sensor histidine kinase DesK n=1 Tax=Paramicrobacterium agarici TaxID=630514 RepID=A0A2A9E0L2_9MICO|nr:histidine kinase [Microbacterium agarici]PFG31915.1 two-component system sensor histidine kinase DesK [Microbacterium agarici]